MDLGISLLDGVDKYTETLKTMGQRKPKSQELDGIVSGADREPGGFSYRGWGEGSNLETMRFTLHLEKNEHAINTMLIATYKQ